MRTSFGGRVLLATASCSLAIVTMGCGAQTSGQGAIGPTSAPPGSLSSTPTPGATSAGPGQAPVPAEKNPPGDIPDGVAYVAYQDPAGGFGFTHPEGWTQNTIPNGVTFTDKLNGIAVTSVIGTSEPTIAGARQTDVPELRRTQAAFEFRSLASVHEPAGSGVLIVYRRNSAPDPVTGKQYRDEVQRYVLLVGRHVVTMELYGPVGSDNVDPYRTMITSLKPL